MTARRRWLAAVAAMAALAASTAACGSRRADGGDAQRLVVHAAASLADPFAELATRFEQDHPDVTVQLNVAGSQALAAQLAQGAPGGVFASADRAQLARVSDLVAGEPVAFAGNGLAVVTPPDNPAGVTSLADLADPAVTVVLADEAVPLGHYTRGLLDVTGIEVSAASEELDARAVLTKVATGSADAGVVYRTDAAAGDVQVVDLPDGDLGITYAVAVLVDQQTAGRAFVDLVLSADGRRVLADHGFTPP